MTLRGIDPDTTPESNQMMANPINNPNNAPVPVRVSHSGVKVRYEPRFPPSRYHTSKAIMYALLPWMR
jgi:hypothetical protein